MGDAICPVARSLDTIGKWWSLLIVREAMLGVRRFSEFQRRLGLARNMLITRLKRLVESGIMEMVPASDGTAYQEYVLTEKGKSLWPVLNAIRQRGQQYLFQPGEERTELLDKKHHKSKANFWLATIGSQMGPQTEISAAHTYFGSRRGRYSLAASPSKSRCIRM